MLSAGLSLLRSATPTSNPESAHIAALTSGAVAAKYSPISGLITDNNYGSYMKPRPLALTSGMGGATGFQALNPQVAPGSTNPDPGASGAAGSINVGGYTPDWKSLIEGDAGLIDVKNMLAAGDAQDLASRNAAIQRALVQFGKVPDLAALASQLGMSQADIQNALGPDVQQLAQENTDAGLSTEARLAQANQDAIRQITNSLNARGILNSGETGFQLDKQNTSNRQGEYEANQKLLDYLQQYQQGYVSAQQAREQQLAQAYSAAADRQYNLNQGSAGQTATFDHTDTAGHPVYRGPNGALFNSDGSPYTPPAPAAPAAPSLSLPTYTGQIARPGQNLAA